MKPIIVAIHGIMTGQVGASWPDRFAAWCDAQGVDAMVLKKEYIALPLPIFNTAFKNRLLARSLANEIELLAQGHHAQGHHAHFRPIDPSWSVDQIEQEYRYRLSETTEPKRPRPIHFVSHSNGTHIALLTIKRLAKLGIPTHTAIFVGSVLPSDLMRNGIARLIGEGHLQAAYTYSSNRDGALAVPRWLPWCAYKDLGISGWTMRGERVQELRLNRQEPDVVTRRFDRYGHGTYFAPEVIHSTFTQFRKDLGV
jgi:hypothetical protein